MALPIIKWTGGKRRLLKEIKKYIPEDYNDYYEPFFGGGALFFDLELKNRKTVINDINKDLINFYIQVRDNPIEVINGFNEVLPTLVKKEKYEEIRKQFNDKIKNEEYDIELACLFLLLNVSAFNGLYRKNKNNEFNTPYANPDRVRKLQRKVIEERVKEGSLLLNQNVEICNEDYSTILSRAKKGDFVFIDSPYIDTFTAYSSGDFPLEEQEKLADLCRELDKRGVYFLATNLDTEKTRELYDGFNLSSIDIVHTAGGGHTFKTKQELFISNVKKKEERNLFNLDI